MALEQGQNFKLRVANAASPYTYTLVAGQRGLTREVASQLINLASKSSGIYGEQAPGRSNLVFNINGVRDLPDAAGLERVYALATALVKLPALFQVVKTDVSPVKVVYQGSMYVGNFSQSDNDQEGATYSFQLTVAAAPTADDMTP
jgi:predicted secreted protein